MCMYCVSVFCFLNILHGNNFIYFDILLIMYRYLIIRLALPVSLHFLFIGVQSFLILGLSFASLMQIIT